MASFDYYIAIYGLFLVMLKSGYRKMVPGEERNPNDF